MTDHFAQRCIERGITSIDGVTLRRNLLRAIRAGRDDLVEKVFCFDGADYWRFRVPEGLFYAVVCKGRIITVYTQEMLKERRAARKIALKRKGRRDVRPR